jgi:hypothetical protein
VYREISPRTIRRSTERKAVLALQMLKEINNTNKSKESNQSNLNNRTFLLTSNTKLLKILISIRLSSNLSASVM